MISSQRLIILVLAINLSIGLLQDFATDPTTYNSRHLLNATGETEQIHATVKNESNMFTAMKQATQQFVQNTIGDQLAWGKAVVTPLLRGINPWAHVRDYDTDIEKTIGGWILWFRVVLMAILALEIFLLIINKKGT